MEIASKQDIGCGVSDLGAVEVLGSGGAPEYLYNINGSNYSIANIFSNLSLGTYTIGAIDIKGCESEIQVEIQEVDPIEVDAGPDQQIEYLGDSTQLEGMFFAEGDVSIMWTPAETVRCADGTRNCLNPVVTPNGTTTYTLTITDEQGCLSTDEVTIEVLKVRPVFTANVFSPNEDGVNDVFNLNGSPTAVQSIVNMNVFDRWGNKIYTGRNLVLNDPASGWDGRLQGVPMSEGVYIWTASLTLTDDRIVNVHGEVTLVR